MSTRYPRPRDPRGPAAPAASSAAALLHRGPQAAAAGYSGAYASAAGAAGAYLPPAPNAALLIDFDNVTLGIQKDLQAELRSLLSSDIIKGKVSVQRAYADWRRYPNYVVPLTENSIDLIFAPAYGAAKKNATDIRLAIDAMELVFTRPEIGTFILLSGDSDFSSLVIKLKEYGKYVIGVGIRESASDLLVQNCDEYYSYNALAGLARTVEEPEAPRDPWELIVEAVDRMARNGDTMRADRLKQVMQEIDPSFDEKNLGMPKFSRFVSEAAHRGLVALTRLENGQYEIAPLRPGTTRDTSRDLPRDAGRDRGRDFSRDAGREAGRDAGRDAPRSSPRDAARDAARDFARDLARDSGRDAGRDAARDATRDVAPDAARDATRDRVDAFDARDFDASVDRSFDENDEETGAEPAARGDRSDRGRSRRRGRSRSGRDLERIGRTDEFAVPTADDVGAEPRPAPEPRDLVPIPVAPTIGAQGERLTRAEAFDLVRRAVDALAASDDARVALPPLREQVFALLGRDSESLSERMFPRIVQDAADNGVVRVARDGDTFTAARAPRPAAPPPAADADATTTAAPPTPPPATPPAAAAAAPRGMGPRGVARGRGGRLGAPPPELLLIGAVPTGAASDGPPAAPTASENVPSADAPAPVAASTSAPPADTPPPPAAEATDTTDTPDTVVASPAVDSVVGGGAQTAAVSDEPAGAPTDTPTEPADADSADDDDAPASAAPSRGRRRGGRGRGRGAGRADATTAPSPEAVPEPVAEPAAVAVAPQPAADDNAASARGRGARKATAKVVAKRAPGPDRGAPAKTAAKRGARKRPANAPAGDADA